MSDPQGGELRTLATALIDEPSITMRANMDDEVLMSLAESIRRTGLINPICVAPRGDRYEIIAGHQRFIACTMARLAAVECRVFDLSGRALERMKIDENAERSNVNPAEEAQYLDRLLREFCHDDVDELAEFACKSRDYVESRLLLLRGDRDIFQAVMDGLIGISVAKELNEIRHDVWRRSYLQAALTGATAKQVKQWRIDAELFEARQQDAIAPSTSSAIASSPVAPSGPACLVCGKTRDLHVMVPHYMHPACKEAILDPMLEAYRGGPHS